MLRETPAPGHGEHTVRAVAQPRAQGAIGRGVRGVVRTTSFVGKELTEVRRQPRLLLTLVLGPFLILFLFGIGYAATPRNTGRVGVLPPDGPRGGQPNRSGAASDSPLALVWAPENPGQPRQGLA